MINNRLAGLSLHVMFLLGEASEKEPYYISELERATSRPRTDVSQAVRRLLRKGWIEGWHEPSPEGTPTPRHYVTITDAGKARLNQASLAEVNAALRPRRNRWR